MLLHLEYMVWSSLASFPSTSLTFQLHVTAKTLGRRLINLELLILQMVIILSAKSLNCDSTLSSKLKYSPYLTVCLLGDFIPSAVWLTPHYQNICLVIQISDLYISCDSGGSYNSKQANNHSIKSPIDSVVTHEN